MKTDSTASMVDPTLPLIDGTAAVARATGVRVKLIGILSRTYGANVQTSSIPGYEAHPLASHLERGILATINSDDPTISGIDLRHEYETAAPRAGLDRGQIRQAQANALEIAFLSQTEKEALRRQRQAVVADG